MKKTSLVLPEDLWRQAKILAIREGKDLRELIIEGLRNLLDSRGSPPNTGPS